MLTLSEAIKQGRLDEFIRRKLRYASGEAARLSSE